MPINFSISPSNRSKMAEALPSYISRLNWYLCKRKKNSVNNHFKLIVYQKIEMKYALTNKNQIARGRE